MTKNNLRNQTVPATKIHISERTWEYAIDVYVFNAFPAPNVRSPNTPILPTKTVKVSAHSTKIKPRSMLCLVVKPRLINRMKIRQSLVADKSLVFMLYTSLATKATIINANVVRAYSMCT